MSESSTTILRRLLDECGVEYFKHEDGDPLRKLEKADEPATSWHMGGASVCAVPIEGSDLLDLWIDHCTPEQAIVATLGNGECTPHGEWESITQTQEVRRVFCDCGYELGMDERDSWPFKSTRLFAMPNYCQECGRKIRKAVKR